MAANADGPSIIRVILRDGQSLKVRPITHEDKEKLKDLFYRLSPQTRYLRFGYMKSYVSDQELDYFTVIHPPDTYAYVALTGEEKEEHIVGVGRWFLTPDKSTAEIAFVVEDTIQIRGIGTALLEQLADAAAKYRIKHFIARVLPENTRMLEVFEESGFSISKRIHEGAYELIFNLEEQEEYAKRQAYREHIAGSAGVRRIFYPRSVAVIGASRNPERVGGKVFRNMLFAGFSGVIFPVNPKTTSVGGVLSYPTVEHVPGDVDLAVIIVPAAQVLEVIDQCARKGVIGVIVISAGFSESGPEGVERQRLLREKALSYGMRLIGPNCLGIMNTDPETSLNAAMAGMMPPRGSVSISSHSGALGIALLDYVKSNNLGIAHFASIGNRIDISSNDLLEFWEDDDNTKVILLYLETFGNPRRFSRLARRLTRKKPIIAVKAGRSEIGGKAATSHTGALAGSDIAVDALFRQAGVIRVNTIEEMFNAAKNLAHQPLPKGPRLAILTNAGGPGVLAVDAAVSYGLSVPPLSEETRQKLAQLLPKEASLTNPVDMIASATGEQFGKALAVILEDPSIDAAIVINIPVRPYQEVASGIQKEMAAYAGEKTVVACFMMSGTNTIEIRTSPDRLIPVYMFPEDAVQAFFHSYTYSQYRILKTGLVPVFPDADEEKARKYLEPSGVLKNGGWLPPETALGLLKEYGIPAAETRTAFSAEEAAKAAREIGFPVVMKLRSTTITHKTDVHGVLLGLKSEDEVRQGYNEMKTRLETAGQGKEMEGVILQPMVNDGEEVILGMSFDPVFGPLVMVGLGGIQVELMKDVAFSIHPLTDIDPDYMFSQLKGLPLLKGWRGSTPRDIDALREVLLRFSALIEDIPEIASIEINPLMVFDQGRGTMAVDARILFRPGAMTFTHSA
ncbi:MAG: GNAT family N-acetyltransferase [Thermodesulfovibrionia bacterium]|nr:GNAT family N-acetyltransferase [Thermodesulfovibrionia bacterium]